MTWWSIFQTANPQGWTDPWGWTDRFSTCICMIYKRSSKFIVWQNWILAKPCDAGSMFIYRMSWFDEGSGKVMLTDIDLKSLVVPGSGFASSWCWRRPRRTLKRRVQHLLQLTPEIMNRHLFWPCTKKQPLTRVVWFRHQRHLSKQV